MWSLGLTVLEFGTSSSLLCTHLVSERGAARIDDIDMLSDALELLLVRVVDECLFVCEPFREDVRSRVSDLPSRASRIASSMKFSSSIFGSKSVSSIDFEKLFREILHDN
jgi:hypothetical protein